MNPCADDFTPRSTPAIQSLSSLTILDEDAGSSGSTGIRLMTPESDKPRQAVDPLPYHMDQVWAPLQIPLLNQIAPYASFPLGFHFGSHQIWSVQPWYNPVIVSGRDCGTSPQPLHGLSSFHPMNPMLAHMSSLKPSAVASPEVVVEGPSTKKPAPSRQMGKERLPKEFNKDGLEGNIKRRDLEYLVSGSKPLACTPSNARRCKISSPAHGLRRATKKTREKSASLLDSTRNPCHYDRRHFSDLSVEMISSLPSSANSAASAASATSSPPWCDNAVPLMCEGPSSSDVPSLDTPKLPDSLHSNNFSISDESRGLQQLPHVRKTARSISPQTSPQHQSLLPLDAQELTELEAPKPSKPSSKTLTDLGQGINKLSVPDATASKNLQSAAAIESDLESLPSFSDMHLLTKDEPKVSGMNMPDQLNSQPCISKNVRPQQDAQPLPSRLESSRKGLISDSDTDTRSNAFSITSNKGAFSTLQRPACTSSGRNATESGSWSQSKRWMSQTSKERMTFQKMLTNLFHLSANNSPFVPQSPAELTAFRAEMADIKKKQLSREVGWRVATMERKRTQSKDSGEEAAKLVPFLLGRQFKDTLSPVFASRNCFAEHVSEEDSQWVPWPSLPEFKDEGDKRSLQHGRRFPLPRLGVNTRSIAIVSDRGCKAPWQMKTVKIDARFIHPPSDFADYHEFPYESPLTESDVPYYLLEAIQAMQEELDD
ncbi:hypothetical protein E4U42_004611 [Claviceps africana]|uniref:Uncharacterized protein n=1 Tax=Claviceps africana TaxID=83212 RepID=A0A8K0J4X4_9HYPO|nr:hypothetical protein E4U42_004611 [Claviceps africana]